MFPNFKLRQGYVERKLVKKLILNRDEYFQAVSLTQLVSIDILVIYEGKLLVGKESMNLPKAVFLSQVGKFTKTSISRKLWREFLSMKLV